MNQPLDIKTLIGKTFTSIVAEENQIIFSNSEEWFILIIDHSPKDAWLYGKVEDLIGKPITYARTTYATEWGREIGFFEIGSGQPYENQIDVWSDITIQDDVCYMRSKLYDYSE